MVKPTGIELWAEIALKFKVSWEFGKCKVCGEERVWRGSDQKWYCAHCWNAYLVDGIRQRNIDDIDDAA